MYPLQNHHQPPPFDLGVLHALGELRQLEGPLLQALVPDHEPRAVPDQQLDPVAVTVHEDEHVPGQEIAPHLPGDHSAQPVEALAHVGAAPVQEIPNFPRNFIHHNPRA